MFSDISFGFQLFFSLFFSFGFVFFVAPSCIRMLQRHKCGQPIREGKGYEQFEELHKSKKNTPTMGGILLLGGILFSSFFWMDLSSFVTRLLLVTGLIFGGIGAYDDLRKLKEKKSGGVSARTKFLIEILIAGLLISAMYLFKDAGSDIYRNSLPLPFISRTFFDFSGYWVVLLWGLYAFIIVGSSNAINLTDGLDGLSSGVTILITLFFLIFSIISMNLVSSGLFCIPYIPEAKEIAVFSAALLGALLGFLWYNASPARVFMGDTGSLAVGALLGVFGMLLHQPFLLGLVSGIPVIETLSVIIQVISYRKWKKRVFLCAPIHHHFEYKGMKENTIVIRFWIVTFLLVLLGFFSLYINAVV